MERLIEQVVDIPSPSRRAFFTLGPIDSRSVLAAMACAVLFFALAYASIQISRFDGTLATIWLPSATAAAILLRTQFTNEVPILLALAIGIACANATVGLPLPPLTASVFALANVVEVSLVVALTRRACGMRPDMVNIEHLARFVWNGGFLAPLASMAIAASILSMGGAPILANLTSWILTHSMGMILIVPTILLIFDALEGKRTVSRTDLAKRAALLIFGLVCAFLVFNQSGFPLLFLIPPITLLYAFRLGSVGTALFVVMVAALTLAMTLSGLGPIAAAQVSAQAQSHVLQAFIAANFLTGLPIAAILHGRSRIMQELDERSRELALLTENTTDALMYYDLEGKCTYASSSVKDVMGEPPESFLGKRPSDRMHKDAQDRIMQAENRLMSGASDKERFTYRRFLDSKHGTPVFLEAECAIAFHPDTGEREGIVVSARDVTERVELELLLTRARRKAEHAAGAKSEFLANMSHEIRTPMNGVLGFAELMLQSELDDNQRKNVELIVQSGRSMMMLLNDILDLSKIEAGQISIDRQPVDLEATIAECAALHRPTAESKGLELHFENNAEEPWVTTDGLRVRQIVLNLIGNAIKFTSVGRVTINYQMDQEEVTIEVTDTGIGIEPDRLKKVFEPFIQGESDTARRFGGTGLGLSISRQLAEMLGGHLDVQSEFGAGSCFKLTLPFIQARPQKDDKAKFDSTMPGLLPSARQSLDAPTGAVSPKTASGAAALVSASLPSGSRILLAEDHDVNRLLATEMLERCGQEVYIAHDGNEAIAMVLDAHLRGDPYDLVLMDVQMPDCDGYEATRAIRGEGIGSNLLPIIALTANAFPEDVAAARRSGMQAHLAKPLEFAKLARVLQRWLPTRIIEEDVAEGDEVSLTGPSHAERLAAEDSSVVRENEEIEARVKGAINKQRDRRKLRDESERHRSSNEHQVLKPPQRSEKAQPMHSPVLLQKWEERREEALQSVREGIASGTFAGDSGAFAMRQLHKLAGTAAIFGEVDLGDKATELERALKLSADRAALMELAHKLIAVANERVEDAELDVGQGHSRGARG